MLLGRLTALTLVLLLALATPAHAAEPAPTTLTLAGTRAFAGNDTTLVVTLAADEGATPVADAAVLLERRVGGEWKQVGTLTTDAEGRATTKAALLRQAADNVFRATYEGNETYAGSASGPVPVPLRKRRSVVRIDAPGTVVDEQQVVVGVVWRTGNGQPVAGRVKLLRRNPGHTWRKFRWLRTDDQGRAQVRVRPRVDTRWRVRAPGMDWVSGDRSAVHRIDNVPPGDPVRLPRRAPSPRVHLPDQRHAVGAGPNPRTTHIPSGMWRQMTGRTWHRGCPVGRPQLRLLRINYWGYDGYRHRGELVAHVDAVGNMRGALSAMYRRQLPIRSMYREDRFGWSRRLQGANDYRSMAAGNTSAFNCRHVVGRPGVRSPHAYGRALDLNTWENPYHSAQGWTPNAWWPSHAHGRVAWRSRSHPVVQVMLRHGLHWTYGTQDSQHFDAPAGNGRVIAPRARVCADEVCH